MRTLTVTIDDETAHWVRGEAARRGITVSTLIRELLERRTGSRDAYKAAMERFLARGPRVLKHKGRYPRRDDLGRSVC